MSLDDINRLALTRLFHQAAKICFGVAQGEQLRLQIYFCFSGAGTAGNCHSLNLGYIQPDGEHFLKFTPAAAA
jgi:hypothetical protein